MANQSYNPLIDSRLYRSWLFIVVNFFLSVLYFSFFSTAFLVSIALTLVAIGIPMMLLTLKTSCQLAEFDRRLIAKRLEFLKLLPRRNNTQLPSVHIHSFDDQPMLLRGVLYVLNKFVMAVVSLLGLVLIVPVFFVEVLLSACGIETGEVTARLSHALTNSLTGFGDSMMGHSYFSEDHSVLLLESEISDAPDETPSLTDMISGESNANVMYYIGADGTLKTYENQA